MYMKDLDEYTEEQLEQELRRRFNQRAQGRCDYCGQLKTAPSCKFHKRHNAPEKFEHLMTLREQLASWCHDQWIHWMTYLFEKGDFGPENEFTIEPESVARWQRQMRTPYMKLSEAEKGSDLEQAGKLLYLLRHELSFSLVGMHFGAKDAMSMKAVLDTVYELSKSLQVGNNPKLVGQTLDVVFGGLVEEHNALTELLDKHAVPEIFEGVDG